MIKITNVFILMNVLNFCAHVRTKKNNVLK